MIELRNDAARFEIDSHVRRVTLSDGRLLVADPLSGPWSINDPRRGGLGCFGVIVGRQTEGRFPDRDVWSSAWDITGRLRDTGSGFGFAPLAPDVGLFALHVAGETVATVQHRYVTNARSLEQHVGFQVMRPVFLKEPKIVAHSLRGAYRWLTLRNAAGKQLGRLYDLSKLPDPSRRTLQLGNPQRRTVVLGGPGVPRFTITAEGDLFTRLLAAGDAGEPITTHTCPGYCLTRDGKLRAQWEAAHRPGEDIAGVMLHVWEGGAGLPDCLCTFRLCQPATYTAKITYTIDRQP